MIRGITVKLYKKTQTGKDALNHPIYTETAVYVDNVLVYPSTEQEVLDTLNITGRKAVYTLAIPKGDTHDWTNTKVEFLGHTFKTIGMPVKGIEAMIPLGWNAKVRAEVYNG